MAVTRQEAKSGTTQSWTVRTWTVCSGIRLVSEKRKKTGVEQEPWFLLVPPFPFSSERRTTRRRRRHHHRPPRQLPQNVLKGVRGKDVGQAHVGGHKQLLTVPPREYRVGGVGGYGVMHVVQGTHVRLGQRIARRSARCHDAIEVVVGHRQRRRRRRRR